MQIGMIGLGRMGANMARRLMRGGHQCVVYDRSPTAVAAMSSEGASGADSLATVVSRLAAPRVVWVMVPAGAPTEQTVMALGDLMSSGDIIIDGGNSFFKDDVRRGQILAKKGIRYVDAGTSGGVAGLERGYCLMVGGDADAFAHIEPILKTLAPGRGDISRTPGRDKVGGTAEEGYLHCGPTGSGHFVKMVHNGIEYGVMQAIAEGFDIMKGASNPTVAPEHRFDLPLRDVAELWRRGSVLTSWLLDLTAKAMLDDPQLAKFVGTVEDSGEGRWTVMTAVEEAVPAEVIAAALFTRFRSRQDHTFAEKVLSAMRFQFGGHVEHGSGG
ncbi:MAG: decarboxylating 6-phosphogluconate dehydrogenase [Kofleriaceae bacterium]|nr:decarboxylating 6-phosphogluconate dehydrogenase [Kofleriaceae bacterium]